MENTAPELKTEPLSIINQRLIDRYGLFENGQARYRLVWSEDQYEHRFGEYSKFDASGNYVKTVTGFCFVPKYKQWMPNQWVLENLVAVPEINKELTTKLSYEPLHGFINVYTGVPLDPTWRAIEFLIENLRSHMAELIGVQYKDPLIDEADPKIAFEVKMKRLKELQEELFGNETDTGDALAYKEGVSVPSNYKEQN
jgi:hypothetical protein